MFSLKKHSQTVQIVALTADDLQSGMYKQVSPELYALTSVTENSVWHQNQSVFDHVIGVFKGLESVLRLSNLTDEQKVSTQA